MTDDYIHLVASPCRYLAKLWDKNNGVDFERKEDADGFAVLVDVLNASVTLRYEGQTLLTLDDSVPGAAPKITATNLAALTEAKKRYPSKPLREDDALSWGLRRMNKVIREGAK